MGLTVRFYSLVGSSVKTVRTAEFATEAAALQAVTEYATATGFTNVRTVEGEDGYSLRYTATTPNGRPGRNIAGADVGGDDYS